MPTNDLTKLRALADTALRDTGNDVEKAAPKVAHELAEKSRRRLLIALCADYLGRIAPATRPKPRGRRREGLHRRLAAIASPETKAGAVLALKAEAADIFARKIRGVGILGRIRMHELRSIAEGLARTTGDFLQRGYDDGVESIALQILAQHAVSADPFALVKDVISPQVAKAAFDEAKVKAAEVIAQHAAAVARDLITAGRTPPMIEGEAVR